MVLAASLGDWFESFDGGLRSASSLMPGTSNGIGAEVSGDLSWLFKCGL